MPDPSTAPSPEPTRPALELDELQRELIGTAWWLLLALGIITTGAGIAVFVWPGATLVVLAVLFGIWLVLAGVLRLVGAIAEKRLTTGWRVLHGVVGAALIAAGISSLANLLTSLSTLVLVIGIFLMIDGIDDLLRAFSGHGTGSRWWLVISGLLGVGAGVLIVSRPGIGVVTLVLLVGVSLLLLGITRIVGAFALRSLAQAA